MGIGFVLFVWLVVGGVLATICGATAAGLVCSLRSRAPQISRRAVITAFVFPFATLAFFAVTFVAYAVYCDVARGVDPGLGDQWQVPLGHGCYLVMIDTPDQAFITGLDHDHEHFGLTGIGSAGSFVAILATTDPKFVVIDLSRRTEQAYLNSESFLAAAQAHGITAGTIVPPGTFYSQRRWSKVDLLSLLFVLAIPLAATAILVSKLLVSIRRGRP